MQKASLPSAGKATDLRNAYAQLLWDSRRIATDAKSVVDDFKNTMLPLISRQDVSNADKIAELEAWIKFTTSKGQAAAAQPKQFKDFTTQLRAFADQAEQEIGDKQSEAQAQLDSYRATIAHIDQQINDLFVNVVEPILAYLGIAGGSWQGIATGGSPLFAFLALLKGIAQGYYEFRQFEVALRNVDQKRRELLAQRDELVQKVIALEKQQDLLGDASTVPSTFRSLADEIANFADRMTTFTNTSPQYVKDAQDVETFIKNGIPVSDAVFASKLQFIKDTAGVDSKLLDIYASAPLSDGSADATTTV
ncbi:hypothetical protein K474DRAFT_1657283 [Panus rudis PR-1116 ss-1]|nr:hypothetical protein K474DRAFT_1657283 [Panus rudis PR-1116 ss-1]